MRHSAEGATSVVVKLYVLAKCANIIQYTEVADKNASKRNIVSKTRYGVLGTAYSTSESHSAPEIAVPMPHLNPGTPPFQGTPATK